MIRNLRRKFIVVAMSSMLAVLIIIVCALNVANYVNTVTRADKILAMLAENGGHFPDGFGENFQQKDRMPGGMKKPMYAREFSAETPYDTRFFSVKLDADGEVITVDTGRIASVKTEEAVAYAQKIHAAGRSKGFVEHYRFLETVDDAGCGRVIFVDCEKELESHRHMMLASAGVSVLGILAVFVLVLVFSKRVFKPVELSYIKQKQFITDASHELKTPLTIISANVDLLEMEGEPNQWTGSIRNQVKRLRGLTEQMVTLSRLEEEGEKQFVSCDLSQIVAETAGTFEPLAMAQSKRVLLHIADGISCMGEEDKLRQMVSLLMDNALKYASADGEIRVELAPAKRGAHAKLTVWNTVSADSGITKGNQDILFERFYRADSSRNSKTGGSGIGLSVVKAIVERHGGRITAESADGESICFTVRL
ncbi:MAG: GHKL domain-containing protein [Lachnospiraceae bacterium]|nr:GHKL domain-containing protein [Lachnospiraceae bacterium]